VLIVENNSSSVGNLPEFLTDSPMLAMRALLKDVFCISLFPNPNITSP
jgi:hypothetical protein